MGKEKTATTVDQRAVPTAEETELNKLLLNRQRELDPLTTALQRAQLESGITLLEGKPLGGNLERLTGKTTVGTLGQLPTIDASKYQVGEDITSQIIQNSLKDIAPQYQASGILDSGVAAKLSGELAKDIRLQTAQNNLDTAMAIEQQNIMNQTQANQFDIQNQFGQQAFDMNTLVQLLNLTLSGSTQLQQPVMAQSQQLSNALAGLRQNIGTQTTKSMNPFLKSFQQSFGENMGVGASAATFAAMGCWVAKEIFGSWENPKTIRARFWINMIGPKWFKNFYWKHGEKFAKFISDKPIFKIMLRPIFEIFSLLGEEKTEIII